MLELIAVSGSLAVKWVSAKGGVSFGGGGCVGGWGVKSLELAESWTGGLG